MDIARRAGWRASAPGLCLLGLLTAGSGLAASGCRVDENDIHRWESTQHGPDKLKAVLTHDKYDNSLRVEAALSLIRMKPRQGRRVGIGILVDALVEVTPEARQALVKELVPAIIAELKKPPLVDAGRDSASAGRSVDAGSSVDAGRDSASAGSSVDAGRDSASAGRSDASFPYKDAAYAMLTADRAVIIADEVLKENLKAALIEWAMADFEHRYENRTQAYGMEQLLRQIGPPAVVGLPKRMTRDAKRLDQMASIVAELGDPPTKEAASTALAGIAAYTTSEAWTKDKTPDVQKANKDSKLEPTPEKFAAQLALYQEEELFRVFGAMKKVGGRPSIDFLLGFAANKAQPEKRRQAALAALEGRIERNHPEDIRRVLEIATADAPDGVLDQAFRRVGEAPRDLVADKLYGLFNSPKWKVRRAAAATLLKISTTQHIDEFMSKLPDGNGFAMPEALTYGALFGDLKGQTPIEALKKHFSSGTGAVRTTAIAYYFTFGTADDLGAVRPLEGDLTRAPVCTTDPDCKWSCEIVKEGSKDRELKEIRSVGDFVRYCVEPAMSERKPEPKKVEKP